MQIVRMPFGYLKAGNRIKKMCSTVPGYGASVTLQSLGIIFRQCASDDKGGILGIWKRFGIPETKGTYWLISFCLLPWFLLLILARHCDISWSKRGC